jgi:hypothetical protein
METSTVRVRPLRFAFLVDPRDRTSLMRIFEVNSSLWGGLFNFIIPLFKKVPKRYRWHHREKISAKTMLEGLVEAFQPDFLIESKPGQAALYGVGFPAGRIRPIDDFAKRDERQRCEIGIDLRSVCDDLYRESYRFVQRHAPEVLIPSSKDRDFKLFFAATFGFLPESGELSDVANVYLKALGGERKAIRAYRFPTSFQPEVCLSAGCDTS